MQITADPVDAYAEEVCSGRILAGPLVRLACERHRQDRKLGPKRGLKWDLPAAMRAINFFPDVLKLAGGTYEGRVFSLEPSQAFIVGSLFGWKTADGFRRFRVAYVEQGKGSGKSPMAAGIGLYMLTADKEPRAEVYAAAVDKDQAKILFRDAVSMVDQSEELSERIHRSGGKGREYNLAYHASGSFFRPISSEYVGGRGKSGPRPHCVLLDEVHEHPSDTMVEFMRAGTKGRTQALILMITNAGVYDPTSVCFRYHEYSEKVLNGHYSDDSFFTYTCSLDKEDDWKDPNVWIKTNPLIGVTISVKYLEEQVREAVGMPSKQSLVQRLHFCVWNQSADPFVDEEVWAANAGTIPLEELRGRECYGGLDLSGKNDLTSLKLIFPIHDMARFIVCSFCRGNGKIKEQEVEIDCQVCKGSGEVHPVIKHVLSFFWTPADNLTRRQDRDRAPYDSWVRQGFLIAKPGETIDYAWVAFTIGDLTKLYDIKCIGFDRLRIDDLRHELDKAGVNVTLVEHGQGFKDMTPAVEILEDDLKERRLRHGGHPVLGWCIANAKVVTDPAGCRKFDKRKATGRIDGAVALAMADRMTVVGATTSEPQFFVLGG